VAAPAAPATDLTQKPQGLLAARQLGPARGCPRQPGLACQPSRCGSARLITRRRRAERRSLRRGLERVVLHKAVAEAAVAGAAAAGGIDQGRTSKDATV